MSDIENIKQSVNSSSLGDSEDLTSGVGNTSVTAESTKSKRETTRSKIAFIYVIAFFGTIAFTFCIGLYNGYAVKEHIDFLIAVSGVLSGPLGFIIGYYFKAASEE